ncbi:hypothetical protein Bacsa_3203 [Phocaeicola salanitronis DSM 18170]|uniref:Uncharacterized protein n=1 Tax=Phocaeicola salanitronis (strain DSM 18170 / JCM 13657 / CCUG 60908 / BL78) TaxID=667015 RepID=F0R4B0_PHOSB|nr:hypothetical protein [Phocaeicola salanitronis]ADY37730.1 hypothetical protein Bacsa_3203 [Phocaeicola salanitronis DSM 18170]
MKAIRLIKFFFDAMYYQFFIFNRDKFRLENPHERTVMLFCGLLFLPAIVFIYPLVKENFDYDLPFIFFILIYYIMYRFMSRYYIKKKKGIEIMRKKPSSMALFSSRLARLEERNLIFVIGNSVTW